MESIRDKAKKIYNKIHHFVNSEDGKKAGETTIRALLSALMLGTMTAVGFDEVSKWQQEMAKAPLSKVARDFLKKPNFVTNVGLKRRERQMALDGITDILQKLNEHTRKKDNNEGPKKLVNRLSGGKIRLPTKEELKKTADDIYKTITKI